VQAPYEAGNLAVAREIAQIHCFNLLRFCFHLVL